MPHVELTREIARRFNFLYCQDRDPGVPGARGACSPQFPRLRGLDGGRMSKSMGNTILLADSPEEIAAKVKQAYTDPKKMRANDPGRPEADPDRRSPGLRGVGVPPQVQSREAPTNRARAAAPAAGLRARQEAPGADPGRHAGPGARAPRAAAARSRRGARRDRGRRPARARGRRADHGCRALGAWASSRPPPRCRDERRSPPARRHRPRRAEHRGAGGSAARCRRDRRARRSGRVPGGGPAAARADGDHQARALRGPARPAAPPDQARRDRHLRHSDRAHHRSSTSRTSS